jgi:membrane-bound lytic murein transglycosylase A
VPLRFRSAPAVLEPVPLGALPGFAGDDLFWAWTAFRRSAEHLAAREPLMRAGVAPSQAQRKVAAAALKANIVDESSARTFFSAHFQAYRVRPDSGANPHAHGFVTGYYEPEVAGSLVRAPDFEAPALARPPDLVQATVEHQGASLAAARRLEDGKLAPYWTRAEIDAGKSIAEPVLWIRDAIELFMIQVQGSARVRLPDGNVVRLAYDGRNGHQYESIGRILVQEGLLRLEDLTLDSLKNWVRSAGQKLGEPGRALMHRNPSYIFFHVLHGVDPALGPTGAEGVPLTPFRSLAVDREIWPYGLPFWID